MIGPREEEVMLGNIIRGPVSARLIVASLDSVIPRWQEDKIM
jgi:hypothetical protein